MTWLLLAGKLLAAFLALGLIVVGVLTLLAVLGVCFMTSDDGRW